jgi:DNA-binding transcriptional MocR family regulator
MAIRWVAQLAAKRTLYMERHDTLVTEIQKQLGPSFEVVTGNAGTYLVKLLPEGFRDTVVAEKAAQSDISTDRYRFAIKKSLANKV